MVPITSFLKQRSRRGCVQFAEPHRVRLVEADSGIDEDVQAAVALRDAGDECVHRVLISDIELA
jgi:hypothetical protein